MDTRRRIGSGLTLGIILTAGWALPAAPEESPASKPASAEAVRVAAKDGTLAFRLTTPEELERLLGKPQSQRSNRDGDMYVQELDYPGVTARFGRLGGPGDAFTLLELIAGGRSVDIGQHRRLVLRTPDDLNKLDHFRGLNGVSLTRLDLREQRTLLNDLTFDSRTVWPTADKLPTGFDPAQVLEEGKNPGLGVHQLHKAGLDGKGVGIAIIDQPLLMNHEEYKDRIVKYTAVEVEGVPPQMHGPAVASIAVGKTCGVAPGAALYYFAVPPWDWQGNEPWAGQLERIVELNRTLTNTPKIRVVSISLGAFSERPNFGRWQAAVKMAEDSGILVVTCDPAFLRLGTLKRVEGRVEPGPEDYERGRYFAGNAGLCVPAANRTIAGCEGPDVYTYDRVGGMSWTVPYMAGVAALGWQMNPGLRPKEMVELWKRTAVKTKVGPVINPAGVIEAIRNLARVDSRTRILQVGLLLDAPAPDAIQVPFPHKARGGRETNEILMVRIVPGLDESNLEKEQRISAFGLQLAVEVQLKGKARQQWADFTRTNIGKSVVVIIDGKVFSKRKISGEAADGWLGIDGDWTLHDAQAFCNRLNRAADSRSSP